MSNRGDRPLVKLEEFGLVVFLKIHIELCSLVDANLKIIVIADVKKTTWPQASKDYLRMKTGILFYYSKGGTLSEYNRHQYRRPRHHYPVH